MTANYAQRLHLMSHEAESRAEPYELVDFYTKAARHIERLEQQNAFYDAQHSRDSAELRRLCQARDDAKKTLAQRDAAFEAVRKQLVKLPRYSFGVSSDGGVLRFNDNTGNWIEFASAHQLFDPVNVDAQCTCPGGDGSLRWPCPAHPPEAKS